MATVYAVDATTGKLRWRERVKWFPTSIISGPITYHDGRLYVPLSSFEVAAAGLPTHECCRSHGGIAALDAITGTAVWRFDTTPHAAKTDRQSRRRADVGPERRGRLEQPDVDAKRGALYFGTGPELVVAGHRHQRRDHCARPEDRREALGFQALADDAWNAACLGGGASCPAENGPDFDFGASVMLVERKQGDLLLAGQKSGEVFALDPDRNGAVVWRKRVGSGSSNGGVHHGLATDGERVYVPVADPERKVAGYVPKPGVYALAVDDGRLLWSHPVEARLQVRPGRTRHWSAWPRWPRASPSGRRGPSAATTTASRPPPWSPTASSTRARSTASCACSMPTTAGCCASSTPSAPFQGNNGVEGHGGAIDVGGAIVMATSCSSCRATACSGRCRATCCWCTGSSAGK